MSNENKINWFLLVVFGLLSACLIYLVVVNGKVEYKDPGSPYDSATSVVVANGDVCNRGCDVFGEVNEFRETYNLPALFEDKDLNRSAQIRADEIALSGVWSHTRPDGTDFSTSIKDQYDTVGENLAECFTSMDAAMQGWIGSKLHNDNMLGILDDNTTDWLLMGTATAYSVSDQCTIYVTHFGN